MDPEERTRFRNILSDVGYGRLVILSTHIVSDVESIFTAIAVKKRRKREMGMIERALTGSEGAP
ncbi:MAG: hypothetical protein ABI718_00620 [Acidobacteriota bacterium]